MIYKSLATNKETSRIEIVEGDFENKDEFIKWFKYNGYMCDEITIKDSDVFDFICNQTSHTPDDFKMIDSVPEDYSGYHKALEVYKKFKLALIHYKRKINKVESMDEKILILSELNGILKALLWCNIDIKLKYHNEDGFFTMEAESAKYNQYYLK